MKATTLPVFSLSRKQFSRLPLRNLYQIKKVKMIISNLNHDHSTLLSFALFLFFQKHKLNIFIVHPPFCKGATLPLHHLQHSLLSLTCVKDSLIKMPFALQLCVLYEMPFLHFTFFYLKQQQKKEISISIHKMIIMLSCQLFLFYRKIFNLFSF